MPNRTVTRCLTSVASYTIAACIRGAVLVAALAVIASPTVQADYAAGLAAFNRKDFTHAFSEWIESAKAGDAHAQHGVGMLYEMGQGVPHADAKAAADWYQKAAAQNYAPALNNLARLYADGRGVSQDVPKAIELWSRAAEAGNATARFNLGLQYANGSGVPKDMKKAASYLLEAAESGLAEAQFAIAGFYRDGTGVDKDVAAARQWYDRAATAGFEPARKELASLDKPAASPTPAVESNEAAPAEQTKKTDAPAQPAATNEQPAEQPAQNPPAAPGVTQQAAVTPPAESKTPEPAAEPAPEPAPQPAPEQQQPEAATTQQPAGQTPTPAPAEQPQETTPAAEQGQAPEQSAEQPAEQPPEQSAEQPAPAQQPAGDAATMDLSNPASDLPLAESITGDARVYRIWLYESGQENDARSYWEKLNQQYPGLLKKLKLDLRRYFLGEARGSLYRVFAGPFDDLGAAQQVCADLKSRSDEQFCRPVLN